MTLTVQGRQPVPARADDPRDGRPWSYVQQYGPHSWAVYLAGRCASSPGSRELAARIARSRNRFERLDLAARAQ